MTVMTHGRPSGLWTTFRSRVTFALPGSSFAIRSNANVLVWPISSPPMPGHGTGAGCCGAAMPGPGPTLLRLDLNLGRRRQSREQGRTRDESRFHPFS